MTLDALERLKEVGANGTTVRLPESFREVHAMHRRIMAFEAAREHGPLFTPTL